MKTLSWGPPTVREANCLPSFSHLQVSQFAVWQKTVFGTLSPESGSTLREKNYCCSFFGPPNRTNRDKPVAPVGKKTPNICYRFLKMEFSFHVSMALSPAHLSVMWHGVQGWVSDKLTVETTTKCCIIHSVTPPTGKPPKPPPTPQTTSMALFLKPDTLRQTPPCVCVCVSACLPACPYTVQTPGGDSWPIVAGVQLKTCPCIYMWMCVRKNASVCLRVGMPVCVFPFTVQTPGGCFVG